MNPMQQMMMQAQRMQRELAKAKAALAEQEFKVSKCGMVELTMKGDRTVAALSIDEAAIDPENKEMLEETIAMAINEAYDKVQAEADAIEERVTGQRGVLGF